MGIPLVSIGLPVYNGQKYLRRAIDSILAQNFRDFELIISDNASTDETSAICLDYERRDSRVRYSRNDHNIGLAGNHNRVVSLSHGRWFKWAAYDDEYPQQMVGKHVEVLEGSGPLVSFVYSQCERIDESGVSYGVSSDHVELKSKLPHRRLAHLLWNASIYNFTYGMIRLDALLRTRHYGGYPMADRVLFAELAMLGEIREIREPLLRLRLHAGRTFQAHTDIRSLRALFDPLQRGKGSFLTLEGRVQLEFIRSACLVPTRWRDKCLCLGVALTVPGWRRFRNFGGLQRQRIINVLHRDRDEIDAEKERQ